MNKYIALVASAARIANGNSAEFENDIAQAAHVAIDVTAASGTTPVLVVTVEAFDPVSGKYYTVIASANITGAGTTILKVGPGLPVAANVSANDVMPKYFRVRWTITGTTPSFTFTVGASLLD